MKKVTEKVDFDLSTQTLSELIEIYDGIIKFIEFVNEKNIVEGEDNEDE